MCSKLCSNPCSEARRDALGMWCLQALDRAIQICEPAYTALAIVLVLLDAYVFFATVLSSVSKANGLAGVLLHTCIGIWLLFNVLWNHLLCVFTKPGSTQDVDSQELYDSMTNEWRWCRKCNLPKPPLSHHCSICNKCIFKMDHHCPWMSNCVGHNNYKYFFLYLWWMWVGSIYSAYMSFMHIPSLMAIKSNSSMTSFLALLTFLLACAVFLAMCGLLGWHVVLVVTGQGTIDALSNYLHQQEAKQAGVPWVNPYHLGWARNWQEALDVSGPLWYLTWCLPSWAPKKGKGWSIPRLPVTTSGVYMQYNPEGYSHQGVTGGGTASWSEGGQPVGVTLSGGYTNAVSRGGYTQGAPIPGAHNLV